MGLLFRRTFALLGACARLYFCLYPCDSFMILSVNAYGLTQTSMCSHIGLILSCPNVPFKLNLLKLKLKIENIITK